MLLNNLSSVPETEPFCFSRDEFSSPAVLLVHGFTSTPLSMRDLGLALHEAGFHAQGIRLPGHGTSPYDLEKTDWQEWYACVKGSYEFLRQRHAKVFICGQSLGALLGLYLASEASPDGVAAISAGLKFKARGQSLIPWIRPFRRFLFKKHGPDIRDPESRQREIHYPWMPLRSLYEIQKLMRTVRGRLVNIRAPLLLIHAAQDRTFDRTTSDALYRHAASAVKERILLPHSGHVATMDYDKDIVRNECIRFFKTI